jgi:hypothetical protein
MKPPVPSPLLAWILVFITLIVGIFILSEVDPVRFHIKQRRADLPKKLQKVQKAKARTDVVFFGDSLMQAAIPPTETELNAVLSRAASMQVKAVNLAMDGRSPWDLERRSKQILGLNPRIIVIQSEMIVKRRVVREKALGYFEIKKERLRNWISYVKNPLMQPLSKGSAKKSKELFEALSSPAQVDIKILKEKSHQDQENLKQVHLKRAREHWSAQIIELRSSEFKSIGNFIKRAESNGTHVIVVEMPLSETAARFASKEYFAQRKQIVLTLLNDPNAYIQYPKVLPDRFFDDYSHANVRGEKAYFKWLAVELAKRLAEKN